MRKETPLEKATGSFGSRGLSIPSHPFFAGVYAALLVGSLAGFAPSFYAFGNAAKMLDMVAVAERGAMIGLLLAGFLSCVAIRNASKYNDDERKLAVQFSRGVWTTAIFLFVLDLIFRDAVFEWIAKNDTY
ncbi:hypothetical protein [Parvularcula sp. LCG005]|uniref:hypothetical protein n=1 Tax=Parvularcula sp. LCG005 TaxID=3078805 RepID=UPI00294254AE|nr:hypothetical protein [Parvularcula sp. LCG005]WOI53714.1 hypothetical protein RUI03_01650 [Parvularcula sp. LCG005]